MKSNAVVKGIARIDEYLKKLNFAAEDYHAAVLIETKETKYRELVKAYAEYFACDAQVRKTFEALHISHNEEQQRNK